MVRVDEPTDPNTVDLDREKKCDECGNDDLDRIQVGGDGVWEDRLHCLECFEYWQVSHEDVIIPLMMRKYGFTRSQAEEAEEARRERYNRQLAESSELS